MKLSKLLITSLITASLLTGFTGCAQKTSKIQAHYISTNFYTNYSCVTLNDIKQELASELSTLTIEQDKVATIDTVAVIGAVIFWPTLIVLAITDDQKDTIKIVKGKYEAVQRAQLYKKCKRSRF